MFREDMSNSLAKKRRANMPTPPPPTVSPVPLNNQSQPLNNQSGGGERKPMTLPQVLSILEKRLTALEKNSVNKPVSETSSTLPAFDSIKETLDEYETRFDMLAEQINYIKDTVMKLQTFTMDVNKSLLEERVQIMREQNSPIVFSDILEKVEKEEDEEEDDE